MSKMSDVQSLQDEWFRNRAQNMSEWVETDFYEELIKMPLWVMSAFGHLKDGYVLAKDDVRIQLITHLVLKSMDKCPGRLYDRDYRADWKIADFIRIVKAVVSAYRIKNYHKKCYGCGDMDKDGNKLPDTTTTCVKCAEPEVIYDKDAGIDKTDKVFPCPDCEFCKKPKTWDTTKYIKGLTFMNKDACLACYEKSLSTDAEPSFTEAEMGRK